MREQKETIKFDDYLKLDVRICEIIGAEKVPDTDKLIRLTVDTGLDTRTAITNIGSIFKPDALVGLKMPFVLNLDPVSIRGIESTAMILASTNSEGSIELIDVDNELGSVVI